jgi:lysozyme family protein
MQHILGTYEDGTISGQSAYADQYVWAVVSREFGYGGSMMVRALQRLVGASEDGYWGKETSTRLQQYLCSKGYQVAVDGYFGTESVSALQRCINDGKFGGE